MQNKQIVKLEQQILHNFFAKSKQILQKRVRYGVTCMHTSVYKSNNEAEAVNDEIRSNQWIQNMTISNISDV